MILLATEEFELWENCDVRSLRNEKLDYKDRNDRMVKIRCPLEVQQLTFAV